MFRQFFIFLSLASVFSICGGCASMMTKPFPQEDGQIYLDVTKEAPDSMKDFPVGVYRVPNTNIHVAEETPEGAWMAFGLLGLAIGDADSRGSIQKKIKDAGELPALDIPSITSELLNKKIQAWKKQGRPGPFDSSGKNRIKIISYVVLSFVDDKNVRPWVILQVEFKDDLWGNTEWFTRYHCGLSDPRPLGGKDGWTSDKGEPLKLAITRNIEKDIDVMLRDIAGDLRKKPGRREKLTCDWVFLEKPVETTVEVLEDAPDDLVVVPQVDDSCVYAGVNIVPRSFEASSNNIQIKK